MRLLSVALVTFLLVGCGSGGGYEGGAGVSPAEARAKCDTFKTTFCTRVLACVSPPPTLKECLDVAASSIDCSKAVDVTPAFDTCISELTAFSCAVFDRGNNTPASCKGVILVPK